MKLSIQHKYYFVDTGQIPKRCLFTFCSLELDVSMDNFDDSIYLNIVTS